MKVLRCRDTGSNCDFVARAQTEQELWQKVGQHAQKAHNMKLTDEMKTQLRKFVREEPAKP